MATGYANPSSPPDPLQEFPAGTRVSRPGFSPGRTVHLLQGTHNNAAERALRVVALGRKNCLFAGSDTSGERAAATYSLIGTAKLNRLDPEGYLREVLSRIADHPIHRIEEQLPRNIAAIAPLVWQPAA